MVFLEISTELISADYLSSGVSRSICQAQEEFVKSGKIIGAGGLKKPPKNLLDEPNECIWYKRDLDLDPGSAFSSKTCAQLGLDSQANSGKTDE